MGNLGGASNISMLGVGNLGLQLNNAGQAVGSSALPDGMSSHAFLWSKKTGMRDLGTLPGDVISGAAAINDAGLIVGQSFDANFNPRPFFWENGQMSDLNDLAAGSSLYLLWPTGINARGEISGFGITEGGDIHGFLATPVPGGPNGLSQAELASAQRSTRPKALPANLLELLGSGAYRLAVPRNR